MVALGKGRRRDHRNYQRAVTLSESATINGSFIYACPRRAKAWLSAATMPHVTTNPSLIQSRGLRNWRPNRTSFLSYNP